MVRLPLTILFLLPALSLAAQQQPPAGLYDHGRDAPTAHATRLSGTIRIDGTLDEAAWAGATPIASFTQLDPAEGQPASETTEIRILYDDAALYIGARLYDRSPVRTRVGRRDMGMAASDWLTLIIDARHDHRTAFGFEVNPAGVRRDQTRASGQEDDSWDPVWEAATTVTDSGWVAEIRIPFSQLRFSGEPVQTWGLQVERQIARNQEFAVWSFTPRDQPGGIPRFGHLTGLTTLETGKRLEVMPYVVARGEYIDRGANPFRSDSEYVLDAGADLKYRLTSSLTLDATVNPDFGQVELDPAVINLTAFETFFPERRPFFIEGSEMFRFGNDGSNSAFYSRRIGRRPSIAPPYTERDVPDEARILGAAKITGRTAGGWAMGMLDAVTGETTARYRTSSGDVGESIAEPLTNYFVGRVRREGRGGQTAVGALLGAVHRNNSTPELKAALRSSAYSGGVDFFHQWAQRNMTLEGFLSGSHVTGEPGVIAATQRLPYHYFQRPDAEHLDYDASRKSLTGFAGNLTLNRRMGRAWSAGAMVNTMSPGYEVSDLGFQRRADRLDVQTSLEYENTQPGTFVRRYSAWGRGLVEHNYNWDNISNRVFGGAYAQFMNYWSGNFELQHSFEGTLDDRLTRGGPAARRTNSTSVYGNVSSDPRRSVVGNFGVFLRDGGNGNEVSIFPNLSIRPAPNWDLSLGPSFSRSHDEAQYLFRVEDPLATQTFGSRYVFAELDQTVVALQARVNYTLRPGLSLQMFAQPFLASGNFGAAKELAAPNTYRFLVYGEDVGEIDNGVVYPNGQGPGAVSFADPDPDYNVRSLRGNAVLRWEWRAGSTLYLAWQQARSSPEEFGDFELRRDLTALRRAGADDVFLLKVSYWFNP